MGHDRVVEWEFPLERTHLGVLLGNGTFGAIVWGDRRLHVTVNRADFWDRRGGHSFTDEMTFANIRECLEQGDEARLRAIFEGEPPRPGEPRRPSVLPMGLLELDFGPKARIVAGRLRLGTGELHVDVQQGKAVHRATLVLSMLEPVLWIRLAKGLALRQVVCRPAWEWVEGHLREIGFEPPEAFDRGRTSGWVQRRPADPPMCLAYRPSKRGLVVTSIYGPDDTKAQRAAGDLLRATRAKGFRAVRQENRAWWAAYWADVPAVELPNDELAEIYEYGMFKFAGLTNPAGVAATLQGPWIEEYQMPPWQSDYHFNINVQECYWPTFAGNRLEHTKPLFDLIRGWETELRRNAKLFVGIDDGRMLPHAVDDRCVCMGGFWTGTIDHGSTAWVGQLMWLYYRYTMDVEFLRTTAFPFMRGALAVYEAMLEEADDGKLALPVSVSPEYGGSGMDAWGRNASFQLAAIHCLVDAVLAACEILDEEPKPIWHAIRDKLPRVCLTGGDQRSGRIALWNGQDLDRSHRHHSHLAAVYPFDTIPYREEPYAGIVQRSLQHWVHKGMGEWSGWCVPWASILNSRVGRPEAAELLLEIWRRVFTNAGRGTLHDVDFAGFSVIGPRRPEIMQIEAGMAAVTAVQEMLLHTAGGVMRIFPGVPARWKDCSFSGMRADGAFLVSAVRRNRRTTEVTVSSEAGEPLRLENTIAEAVVVRRDGREETVTGDVIELETEKGETLTIVPAPDE